MSSASERRTHSRFPFRSRLEVRQRRGGRTPSGADVERVARAIGLDVSVGGLGFKSALPLAVGDLISVSLSDAELSGRSAAEAAGDPAGGFEIFAVVRHVQRLDGEYVIGAERRGEAAQQN